MRNDYTPHGFKKDPLQISMEEPLYTLDDVLRLVRNMLAGVGLGAVVVIGLFAWGYLS